MANFVFGLIARGGEIVVFLLCLGVVGAGAIWLVCFIAGELQRIGRKRATANREALEESLALQKAKDEMRKRDIRLAKERVAAAKMRDNEIDIFEEMRRKVANDLE